MCWLHIIAWDHWKRMDSVTWQFWGASVQFLQTEKIGNQKMGSESKLRKVNIYILEVLHPPTVYIHNSWFNQQFVQSFIFGATSVLFLNCHFWAKTSLVILKLKICKMKRDKIYSNSSLNIIRLVGSTKMWFSARWLQKPWYCNSGTWEGSWTFQWKIFGCSWTNLSARGWRGKIPLFKILQLWISSHASFHCGFQVELAFELQDFYGITGTALGWGKGEGGITTGKLGSQK